MKPIKLHLGCGEDYKEGWVNVDRYSKSDIKHDLNNYPYPFEDNSVDYILAEHIVEHLDDTLDFFTEAYRILKKGGRLRVQVPHCNADGATYGCFEHKHAYHESAINNVTGVQLSAWRDHPFKLIKTIVTRGRFLKWQKRGIIWIIEK